MNGFSSHLAEILIILLEVCFPIWVFLRFLVFYLFQFCQDKFRETAKVQKIAQHAVIEFLKKESIEYLEITECLKKVNTDAALSESTVKR